jgi:hypothetical protein
MLEKGRVDVVADREKDSENSAVKEDLVLKLSGS